MVVHPPPASLPGKGSLVLLEPICPPQEVVDMLNKLDDHPLAKLSEKRRATFASYAVPRALIVLCFAWMTLDVVRTGLMKHAATGGRRRCSRNGTPTRSKGA